MYMLPFEMKQKKSSYLELIWISIKWHAAHFIRTKAYGERGFRNYHSIILI